MKSVKYYLIALIFSCFSLVHSQVYLNLDFEETTSNGIVKDWKLGGNGYDLKIDSNICFSGKNSLYIEKIGNGNVGVGTSSFPIEDARGKQLKYSGYIKTENITEGFAGLWWRVDGASATLSFDNMAKRDIKGTTGWTKYTIEFKIDEKVTNINFGVIHPGNGKAWFDNLEIELDGKKYQQSEPHVITLSDEQTNLLKEIVYPFETAEPAHNNNDLNFLKEMVGDAKIVSLGEGTHGTSEFFKMKHRITKYLAEEMGFTVFAIEANMPEATKVNDYILYGKGNAKDALAGLYFWTWNTQEVLDMIEWMREFNKSKKGRVEFWGFDMQHPNVAIKNTLNFIQKTDPEFFEKAKNKYDKIMSFNDETRKTRTNPTNIYIEPFLNYANEVYDYMKVNSSKYKKSSQSDSTEWILQNAKIVVQSLEARMQNQMSRDESMALNVQWILNNMPKDTKIVLWAHNGHISKKKSNWLPMGAHLDKMYGENMVVMGFCFHEGNYTALGKNKLSVYSTSISEPGSLEWMMHGLNVPMSFLDLRKVKNSPLSKLFESEIEFRSIGALAMDYAFNRTKILDEFDALIYFDKTNPSKCFGLTSEKGGVK
ncbi:MAG: erythromycin esterase family protein [Melioribacteraceae bacterium]